MKTNKIFILVNELEENQFVKMPESVGLEVTFQDLLSMNKNEMVTITVEDIFIGNTASWNSIKERIEEYQDLAVLREGKLEVIYYSVYDALTRLYTNDADDYFHFYDSCVSREEIEELIQQFPLSFDCKFINRSNQNLKDEILMEVNNGDTGLKTNSFNFDFLTISNKIDLLKMA